MYELKSRVSQMCAQMGVSVNEYYRRCRDEFHSDVRRVIHYMLYNEGFSYSLISRDCGMNHATVMHNVRVCGSMIEIEDTFTMILIRRLEHGR